MAKVSYWQLCKGLKKGEQTGKFLPARPFEAIARTDSPVVFTCVVYWSGHIGERFNQSFALLDDVGNLLDKTPKMECILTGDDTCIGIAHFYSSFPHPGRYSINVFQNDICVEEIAVNVIEANPFYREALAAGQAAGTQSRFSGI